MSSSTSSPSSTIELSNLKIFTLNCWGLRYFSDHRQVRIKHIAQHLFEHNYDVVFLQEVWIQSDFDHIRSKTKSLYKFAHMYNNASILGTSGLVILSKWVPNMIHFHPYTINGSPFKPFHGDWYSTKGVAYARIELNGLNLHLFCTHMHAQYDVDEKITDQYSIHRICQSYELAKFINLMVCNCSHSSSKDLIVLAGDMNTSSKEMPYRLLVELTDLNDCYKFADKSNSILNFDKFDDSSEDLITCCHKENTFTPKPSLETQKSAKRIDFILFKVRDPNMINLLKWNESVNGSETLKINYSIMLCYVEQIRVVSKDISGLSFSDHQPVAAKLNFNLINGQDFIKDIRDANELDRQSTKPDSVNNSHIDMENVKSKDHSESKFSILKVCSKLKQKTEEHLHSFQLKQMANNMLCHPFSFSSSQPLYKRLKNSPLIQDIEEYLTEYLRKNNPSYTHFLVLGILLFLITVCLVIVLSFTIHLTAIETILICIIFIIIFIVVLLLKFINHRTEMNAVNAILNDIRNKRTFCPEYGLLESD